MGRAYGLVVLVVVTGCALRDCAEEKTVPPAPMDAAMGDASNGEPDSGEHERECARRKKIRDNCLDSAFCALQAGDKDPVTANPEDRLLLCGLLGDHSGTPCEACVPQCDDGARPTHTEPCSNCFPGGTGTPPELKVCHDAAEAYAPGCVYTGPSLEGCP